MISGVLTQHDPMLFSGSLHGHVCILFDRVVVLLHCMSALEDAVGGSPPQSRSVTSLGTRQQI